MKKQLRGKFGALVDVIGETDDYYWVRYVDESSSTTPFTIDKESTIWTVERPTPKFGDVWTSRSSKTEYRVLGVGEDCYALVRREDYDDGTWPTPGAALQTDAAITTRTIHVRRLPVEYLELTARQL